MSEFLRTITPGALGTVGALLIGVVTVLALFIGFCILLYFPKMRQSGRQSHVVRGLTELVGGRETYLPADAPRGRVDQLRTPELLELQARKSA
jgi:hypothetical protein